LQLQQANHTQQIGTLLQTVANLELNEDTSSSSGSNTADPESEPLDFSIIRPRSSIEGKNIRLLTDQMSLTMRQAPFTNCLNYLKEKISQSQGVLDALVLRENKINGLSLKSCIIKVKKSKKQQLYSHSDYKQIQELDLEISRIET
jgi:hypothetical protein